MSFVHDAIHIVVSGVRGVVDSSDAGSIDMEPKLLEYAMPVYGQWLAIYLSTLQ